MTADMNVVAVAIARRDLGMSAVAVTTTARMVESTRPVTTTTVEVVTMSMCADQPMTLTMHDEIGQDRPFACATMIVSVEAMTVAKGTESKRLHGENRENCVVSPCSGGTQILL
jgi:hypothetical protein